MAMIKDDLDEKIFSLSMEQQSFLFHDLHQSEACVIDVIRRNLIIFDRFILSC